MAFGIGIASDQSQCSVILFALLAATPERDLSFQTKTIT